MGYHPYESTTLNEGFGSEGASVWLSCHSALAYALPSTNTTPAYT
jgi:hypothetical protein